MKLDSRYEKLAIVFSIILLVLVCGTGYWVYSKLSTVADNIVLDRSKDSRLLMLKELNNDLVTAENYAFSYTITKKDSLLTKFYLLETKSAFKIKQLRRIPSNDKKYVTYIDTLGSLVNRRFRTMEDLVLVQNENRVNDAMDQVIHEVKSMARTKLTQPVAAPDEEDKKERRRLFQRRLEAQKEKSEKPVRKTATVNAASVNAGLIQIKKDVVSEEQAKNVRKLGIEQRNNYLIARFTQLIQSIENQEKKAILQEAEHAKKIAEETNVIIALFCLTSVLLIGFTSYLIFTFVAKTKATNRQLQIAKQKSDQLTRSKSQFLANMSHEIRTPLNAIVGFAEQLKNSGLKENQEAKVNIIEKAADHLTQITNEILDFSKLSAGAIQLENIPFSIRSEVDFVISTLDQIAQKSSNTIQARIDEELPPFVSGDPMRMRQVLLNLMGNALKFTEKGTITLSIRPDLQSSTETTMIIEIKDTGIGISETNLARIFDEFEQAETSISRNFGGTGLGLSITRMLVDNMGGTIAVKSEVGKGTTFTVTIPFSIPAEAVEEIPKAVTHSLDIIRDKKVLIVDDEAYNRKLLRNILEKAGVKMTEASDGIEAIEALERSDYDLVLLDLRMPNMDGFETMKAIRKLSGQKKNIPVIALTAAISQEERFEMVKGHWKGVLLKPFKVNELAACLTSVFGIEEAPEKSSTIQQPKAEQPAATKFNLQPLRELSGTDNAFYMDMLSTLHRTTLDGINAIQQTSQLKDWLGMAEAAHKIAAPVKHLQAIDIYEQLKTLEHAGRTNKIESSIGERIKKLDADIQDILKSIDLEIEQTRAKL